jgi:hypothetical protein
VGQHTPKKTPLKKLACITAIGSNHVEAAYHPLLFELLLPKYLLKSYSFLIVAG